MDNKTIMGLDVSTSTIGLSIAAYINDELKILEVTHLKFSQGNKFKGTSGLFLKAQLFKEMIEKYKEYNIDTVVIEEPLLGSNNVYTVATLLKFNGIISQNVYDTLGVIPEYISSYDARLFGIPELISVRKYNKKGEEYPKPKIKSALKKSNVVLFGSYPWDISKKEVLWNFVSDMFPAIQWVYDKNGKLKKENFDASDSLICILGYVNQLKYKDDKPSVINIKEQEDNKNYITYDIEFCGRKMNKAISLSE